MQPDLFKSRANYLTNKRFLAMIALRDANFNIIFEFAYLNWSMKRYRDILLLLVYILIYNYGGLAQTQPDSYEYYLSLYDQARAAQVLDDSLEVLHTDTLSDHVFLWLRSALLWSWTDSLKRAGLRHQEWKERLKTRPASPVELADEAFYQAILLQNKQDYHGAIDSLIQSVYARPIKSRLDSILLADTYSTIAAMYKKLKDLPESRKYYDQSVNLDRILKRDKALATNLLNLSEILSDINPQNHKADTVLSQAVTLAESLGDPAYLAAGYNQLGVLASRRALHHQALIYFKKSLDIKISYLTTNSPGLEISWNNVAYQFFLLKNPDSAGYYFSQALEYARHTKQNLAPFYMNLGIVNARAKHFPIALDYIQHAIAQFDTLVSPTDISDNPVNLVQSPDLAEYLGVKSNALYRYALETGNLQDLKLGMATSLVALNMLDTLRFLRSFDSKALFAGQMRDYYLIALRLSLDLYHRTGNEVYLEQALNLSGRNKAALLNEFIRMDEARSAISKSATWILKEDSIKLHISRLESAIANIENKKVSSNRLITLNKKLLQSEESLKRLSIRIKQQHPEYYQTVYERKGYQSEELQNCLSPEQSLIEYTIDGNNLIIFHLTRQHLTCHQLSLPDLFFNSIDSLLANLTPIISNRICRNYVTAAYRLYQYLLAPVADEINGKQLYIIPDNQLGIIPFETLVQDTTGYQLADFRYLNYLNRHYTFTYLNSQEQLIRISEKKQIQVFNRVYGFAPFVDQGFDLAFKHFPRLKYSGVELRKIAAIFRSRDYLGSKATEARFRQALNRKAILHLSSHAILSEKNPKITRLLFYPSDKDYEFYFFELLGLHIQSPLVVLNACNTGSGKIQSGEGVFSMARGFQFAGVNSLISTLWQVEDRSSSIIIESFYKHLKSGFSKSEALRVAKNAYLIQADASYASPFFWAGQILIGDDHPMKYQPFPRKTLWILFALGGVFLLLILIKKILDLHSK